MNTKIGIISIAILLLLVAVVSADYSIPGSDIECDPAKVAQLAIQDDCDVQGNLDKTTTYSAGINVELAKRDCTQRVKPTNKCSWTEEDLKLCEATVEQYCGEMNKYPSLWERDETGGMVDRDVQTVVEEGGVPSFAEGTDEEGEPIAPVEDIGTTTEPAPEPAPVQEPQKSNSWLWWVIVIVIIIAAVWYFMSQKGSKKPVAKVASKPAKKEEHKKKKK